MTTRAQLRLEGQHGAEMMGTSQRSHGPGMEALVEGHPEDAKGSQK